MARYPTFDEYARTGKYAEGIKRCDELLRRNPKDVTLLITKLQLLGASQQDVSPTLDQILDIQPPISDFKELVPIEAAIVDSAKHVYPRPVSTGLAMSKLWDNAYKASNNQRYKISLIEVRFDRAVMDNRIQDVQQTLITLKALQPKNRAVYMAHAAYTQLLSGAKDDLQSKLAFGLARKAVQENFDEDKSLDCRVPGQIFAIQGAEDDLKGIANRSFRESQQVYKALKLSEPIKINSAEASQEKGVDPTKVSSREWLLAEVDSLQKDFKDLVNGNASPDLLVKFVANATMLFKTSTTSLDLGGRDRGAADAIFLAISGLVKLFADSVDRTYLLQAAYLAERLLAYNGDFHEARLILVYLYMQLHLGSLAMKLFHSLSVKEIQHDTVGHTLLCNLSTLHPFRTNFPAKEFFDPYERTARALSMYLRHEERLAETESGILNHAQTGMIFDLQDLRKNLSDSLPRRMFVLEHRRIARVTGKAYARNTSEIGPRVVANWTNTKDNRDFNGAFDYGLKVEKVLCAEETSILSKLAADTAWSLATKQTALILDPSNLSPAIQSTPIPTAHSLGSQICITLIQILTSSSPPPRESIQTLLTQLKRLPLEALAQSQSTICETLPDHFIYMDVLLVTQQACRYIKENETQIPTELAQVQECCSKGVKILNGHAVEQGAGVKSHIVKGKILETEGLKGLLDEDELDRFVGSVVASAKEGWEGVAKVAVS